MSKDIYREFCLKNSSMPIFLKDWWMDAVCDDNWDAIVIEKGGVPTAAMPYFYKLNGRNKVIGQPILTQVNGVWFNYPKGQKYCTKLSFEKENLNLIIEQLEKIGLDYYSQNFHYTFTNWLPFYWKGYKQTTRYTYVIDDIQDMDKVQLEFDSKLKNQIKKAEKKVEVCEDLSIDDFYKINKMTFDRQNMSIPYSLERLKKIDNACIEHGCRKIFSALDDKKNLHAAIYVIWDNNSAYYLMGGVNPEFKYSEATSLLIMEAIKYVSQYVNKFDLEGSMVEGIEKFFRSFGAKQIPYFNISNIFKEKYAIKSAIYEVYHCNKTLKKFVKSLRR